MEQFVKWNQITITKLLVEREHENKNKQTTKKKRVKNFNQV